jgi:dihydrolipoamide dehydrogenase
MNSKNQYDAAVVGGGPGGYCAAIRTAQAGGRVILFEQEKLGGVCLNAGCIPTKYLLEKAMLLDHIARDTRSGIFRDAGLYNWKKIQSGKDAAVRRLVSGVEAAVAGHGVEIVKGAAKVRRAGTVEGPDGAEYAARAIILATGSRPIRPSIPGAGNPFVVDSSGALALEMVPRSLVVIGGGVIGLEFASIYHAMGSDVTVLEMLPSLLPKEDKDLSAALVRAMGKRGVHILTGIRVGEFTTSRDHCTVRYAIGSEAGALPADKVLIAAGRAPNLTGIDAAALGLKLDERGNVAVNRRQETSVPGIYAVGDVSGGWQLAHTAYAEADTAAANCMGGSAETSLETAPRCIYSLPQAAAIGAAEQRLEQENVSYNKGIVPYGTNGKAIVSEEAEGFIKMLSEQKTGRLLGVHIMGAYATELLGPALTAMNLHATAADLAGMVFPHPTLSELVKEAAQACMGRALHLPSSFTFTQLL